MFESCLVDPSTLPATGSGAVPVVTAALIAVTIGLLLLLASRRRTWPVLTLVAVAVFVAIPTGHASAADPCTAAIGDYVWYDADRDGIQDDNETGIAGITVRLTDATGNSVTTITDASGAYLFSGLPAGTYWVEFPATTNDGMTLTVGGAGTDSATDSNPAPDGTTEPTHLAVGTTRRDIDAGYSAPATTTTTSTTTTTTSTTTTTTSTTTTTTLPPLGSICGTYVDRRYQYDRRIDTITDVLRERLTSSMTISLVEAGPDGSIGTGDDTPVGSTTTGADGDYCFTDLPAGNYQVAATTFPLDESYTFSTSSDDSVSGQIPGIYQRGTAVVAYTPSTRGPAEIGRGSIDATGNFRFPLSYPTRVSDIELRIEPAPTDRVPYTEIRRIGGDLATWFVGDWEFLDGIDRHQVALATGEHVVDQDFIAFNYEWSTSSSF